jgi:hypothetical protein
VKLNNIVLSIIIVVFLVGGIGTAMILNVWQPKPEKAISSSTDSNAVTTYNPADIKGTSSFAEISQMINIPLDEFCKKPGRLESQGVENYISESG